MASKTERRRLIVVLGEREAPARIYFEALERKNYEDGTPAPAQKVEIEASIEEVEEWLGEAHQRQQENIADMTARFEAEKKAHGEECSKLRQDLQAAGSTIEKLTAIAKITGERLERVRALTLQLAAAVDPPPPSRPQPAQAQEEAPAK